MFCGERMSTLQSYILWFVLAGIAIVVVIVMVKKRESSNWGFKDVVKNPEYWEGVSQLQDQVDAAAQAAKRWDDEKVASVTREFVFKATSSHDAWEQARLLRGLGERTHSTILEFLGNTDLYARLVRPTGEDLLPEAPFNRACDLMGDAPPFAAVEVLAPFLNDPSEEIRKDAALAIAKTGALTISPHVKKAFLDEDEYVRSHALMGLEFALNRSDLPENLSHDLFPDVLKLLREGMNADEAADILYRLDKERAKVFFLSQEVFSSESPILQEVLQTLANRRVPVPRDHLRGLIETLEPKEMKYPWTYALGDALRLLGQQQRNEDRDFLHTRTTHSEERVAQGAAEGLLCSFGLDGFEQRIWETEKRSGYEELSEHQKFYSAVFMCDSEISNGGLAQYFVNSSGDNWRDAVTGFKTMGFKERLNILNEAISIFGADGPSTDRSVRQNQLSKIYKQYDSIFEELSSRYHKSSEIVEVLVTRFVIANRDSFQ
jgi:hypothetical protein